MHKAKAEMDMTDNPKIYRHARRYYLAQAGLIKCTFCPYHHGENAERVPQKNWKRQRRKQYREE